MSLLTISTILISLALVQYSIGIWTERISRRLKAWHLLFFWSGLLFDISGTLAMHKLSGGKFILTDPHTLTGQLALWLMFGHAIWASVVIARNIDSMKDRFHSISIFVWAIWLIPYIGGMVLAMR